MARPKDVNEVVLEGLLGRDAEVKHFAASGAAMTKLNLATGKSWKDKKTDEWKKETQWHNVVFWGEFQARKGDRVRCQGTLTYREYEKDGGKVRMTEIKCFEAPEVIQVAEEDWTPKSGRPAVRDYR